MSLSTWPGANITSSPGFQLAGTVLVAGASLVHPARIPGYRFLRPLKAKIVASVAIVAVLGVILLSPSIDTNISSYDAALEDSIARMNQQSLDEAVWKDEGHELTAEYEPLAAELFVSAPIDEAVLFEFSMDELTTRLGLNSFYTTLRHMTIAEPLKNLDAHLHDVSGFDNDLNATPRSYLQGLDTLYHTLDRNNVFDWSIYDVISTLLFIKLYLAIVRRLFAWIFGRQAPAAPKPELSLISNFVFAEPTARIERYVPELDASLQLFATISLERDGRHHSTGYIFDMYNGSSHTGKLLVQRPALHEAVKPSGIRSFVQGLRRCVHVVASFIRMIHNFVMSSFTWCCGKLKTDDKVQREAWQRALEQSFVEEGDIANEDSSPGPLDFSDNVLMGLDVTGVVNIDESAHYALSDSECPDSPDSRGSYHSVQSTLSDDESVSVQPDSDNSNAIEKEVAKVDCMNTQTDTEEGSSSTEKLLRGATRAVDELLSSTTDAADKANNELYKSMRIVKDLLAALSGQIAALDIPEDDYSHYLSDLEERSDLEQSGNDIGMPCSELALVTNTQSGFTYECTSHGDDDSLTLKFAVRDSGKDIPSLVPSGELSLIRKKDGPLASGSCTTVIATGPIFSPPFLQPSDPDAPIFVVIPGFRRQRKRPKNRSRGQGRAKHNKEAEASTDSE